MFICLLVNWSRVVLFTGSLSLVSSFPFVNEFRWSEALKLELFGISDVLSLQGCFLILKLLLQVDLQLSEF
jgi:hypothetical protein